MFGAFALGDVAKEADMSNELSGGALHAGEIELEDASILQFDLALKRIAGMFVELHHLGAEKVGLLQLAHDDLKRGIGIAALGHVRRDRPHVEKTPVEG